MNRTTSPGCGRSSRISIDNCCFRFSGSLNLVVLSVAVGSACASLDAGSGRPVGMITHRERFDGGSMYVAGFYFAAWSTSLREVPDLLIQGHEIEVVPGLNNLSVFDPDDGDAVEVDRRLSRLSSEKLSFVFATY